MNITIFFGHNSIMNVRNSPGKIGHTNSIMNVRKTQQLHHEWKDFFGWHSYQADLTYGMATISRLFKL